jgi:hypothetical protein
MLGMCYTVQIVIVSELRVSLTHHSAQHLCFFKGHLDNMLVTQ